MASMLVKLKKIYEALGLATGFFYVLDRIFDRLHLPVTLRRYLLVAQPVSSAPRLPMRHRKDWRFVRLQPDDPAFQALPIQRSVVEWRILQGAECFGLFRGDALAAYAWLVFGSYCEDEVRCRFQMQPATEMAWDFDVYVFPKYRLGFAFTALWDGVDAYLRERGVKWCVSRISAFNLQSHRSHKSLGAKGYGRATFFTAGAFQLMISSAPPWLHLSFSKQQTPTIRIYARRMAKTNDSSS